MRRATSRTSVTCRAPLPPGNANTALGKGKKNTFVWIPERVEDALESTGLNAVKDDPTYAKSIELVRALLGQNAVDNGSEPALELIAAATIMIAAANDVRAAVSMRVETPLLEHYRPDHAELSATAAALTLLLQNRDLARERGAS